MKKYMPRTFVAFDGEGITRNDDRVTLSRKNYEAALDALAKEKLAEHEYATRPYLDALGTTGKISPAYVIKKNRNVMRGEFANVPKQFLGGFSTPEGDIDKIASLASANLGYEIDASEYLDWICDYVPARLAIYRAEAIEQLGTFEQYAPPPHDYTLLASSNGDSVAQYAAGGLSSAACIDFLFAAARPGATHVVYGGGYDFTQILKDLSHEDAKRVYESERRCGERVTIGNRQYLISVRMRKSLFIKRLWDKRTITIYDVLGFFQCSFVDALKKAFGARIYEVIPEFDEIVRMKGERSSFGENDCGEIRHYCISECRALVALCEDLSQRIEGAGLRPSRFDGAGALASAAFRKHKVREFFAAYDPADPWSLASATAYFGGRVEMMRIGRAGAAYSYDIRSAYPSIALDLPELAYPPERGVDVQKFGIVFAIFRFPPGLPWYPLPYRTPEKAILFPYQGAGWYHTSEVRAAHAFALRFGGAVELVDGWIWDDNGERPFAFVREYYQQRREMKRLGDGAETILKLTINAVYGKSAQQIGGERGAAPSCFCPVWAGAITAGTRAQIMFAALSLTDPADLLAISTDGIFSSKKISGLDESDSLGAWESSLTSDYIIAQPGVYWFRKEGGWIAKNRGFEKISLADPNVALDAWEAGQREVAIPTTRFLSLGTSTVNELRYSIRGRWTKEPRTLNLSGHSPKRYPYLTGNPARESLALIPREADAYEQFRKPSLAYPFKFEITPERRRDLDGEMEYEGLEF